MKDIRYRYRIQKADPKQGKDFGKETDDKQNRNTNRGAFAERRQSGEGNHDAFTADQTDQLAEYDVGSDGNGRTDLFKLLNALNRKFQVTRSVVPAKQAEIHDGKQNIQEPEKSDEGAVFGKPCAASAFFCRS